MEIVCCLDDNYVMPCGVLLISICENNSKEDIVFHLISNGLSLVNRENLEQIVYKYENKVSFYTISGNNIDEFIRKDSLKYITNATFIRFYIASLLPTSITKVIYLDCDIIVRGSLIDLWDVDVAKVAVGAVIDVSCHDIRFFNRLEYDINLGYFNAGVLLLNLDYWRINRIENEIVNYFANNFHKCKYLDQDVLNYVLRENRVLVPLKFNVMNDFLCHFETLFIGKLYWEEMRDASNNPVVIHYLSSNKPWYIECNHPYKEEWLKYYRLSVWGNRRLKSQRGIVLRVLSAVMPLLKFILLKLHLIKTPSSKYRADLSLNSDYGDK